MAVFQKDFYVRFSDIDKNNRLKLTSVLDFFQEIGGIHTSSLGFGLYDIPKTNFAWIVLHWNIKIFELPKCYDELTVKTWARPSEEFFCYRDYEIRDKRTNKLLFCATSKWVTLDVEKQRIEKVPEDTKMLIVPEENAIIETDFGKIREPNSYTYSVDYTVLKYDVDTNNHMNNTRYIGLAFEALPESFNNFDFSNSSIEVIYKTGAKLGENLKCLYSKINDNEHIVCIKNSNLSKSHTIIKFSI